MCMVCAYVCVYVCLRACVSVCLCVFCCICVLQRLASGVQDLSEVTFLEMQVNTREQMLGSLGTSVPNLLQLKLNDSHILSIRCVDVVPGWVCCCMQPACTYTHSMLFPFLRDLGTSLHNLRVLWMARCGL